MLPCQPQDMILELEPGPHLFLHMLREEKQAFWGGATHSRTPLKEKFFTEQISSHFRTLPRELKAHVSDTDNQLIDIVQAMRKSNPPQVIAAPPSLVQVEAGKTDLKFLGRAKPCCLESIQSPFDLKASPRKAETVQARYDVDRLPDPLFRERRSLEQDICLGQSRLQEGTGLWPARGFKAGEVVLQSMLDWSASSSESGSTVCLLKCRLKAGQGTAKATYMAKLLESRHIEASLHFVSPACKASSHDKGFCTPGLHVLEEEWILGPYSAPCLLLKAKGDIAPFSGELGVWMREADMASGSSTKKLENATQKLAALADATVSTPPTNRQLFLESPKISPGDDESLPLDQLSSLSDIYDIPASTAADKKRKAPDAGEDVEAMEPETETEAMPAEKKLRPAVSASQEEAAPEGGVAKTIVFASEEEVAPEEGVAKTVAEEQAAPAPEEGIAKTIKIGDIAGVAEIHVDMELQSVVFVQAAKKKRLDKWSEIFSTTEGKVEEISCEHFDQQAVPEHVLESLIFTVTKSSQVYFKKEVVKLGDVLQDDAIVGLQNHNYNGTSIQKKTEEKKDGKEEGVCLR